MKIEFRLSVPPTKPINSGRYALVSEEYPLNENLQEGSRGRIWFDRERGGVVCEELGRENLPFRMVMSDFDGLLVDTEGPDRYFPVCWRALMREAGIGGSDEDLEQLRMKVYQWNEILLNSARSMVTRIVRGVDINYRRLTQEEYQALRLLLAPETLRQWVQLNERDYGSNLYDCAPKIIADRKEQIGAQMLADDPSLVSEMAPFFPGAVDFVKMLPRGVIFGIASGSRVETTIRPILEAHAALGSRFPLDRVGTLIVGEENLIGSHHKPDKDYYQNAVITTALILHREGRVPESGVGIGDTLFLGDRIARSTDVDAPVTRKGTHHLIINAGIERNLGPLTALCPDFSTLMAEITRPLSQVENPTLRRLTVTVEKIE